MQYGYVSETGNAMVARMLTRGGLQSMMWTLSLILCSLSFGGVMSVTGMLETHRKEHLEICKKRWFSDFLYHLHLRFYEPCIW